MVAQSMGEIENLYRQLLDAWNQGNAHDFAGLIAEDGNVVGFDGSQMNGRAEVETELSRIFNDHQTAAYIAKVREVRFLTPETAVLRAVVGMIPAGQSDINPATNSIQTLVATKQGNGWTIAVFQNTPAQFHGRPEVSAALTEELRQLI
jgi:uncharacterized protein (TIGR02246 family)